MTAEALTTGTRKQPNERTRSKVCRYCEGIHWSDECKKYSTIEDRKTKIKGSCYICLKQGHISKQCRLNKTCVHCGKSNSHHRSLCPKKIPMKSARTESAHFIEESEVTEPYYTINEEADQSTTENVLVSSSEIVLMQTAITEVQNPQQDISKEIRIMVDSGSQRTYITESLAMKLRLERGSVQEITLITFGSNKPKIIRTPTTKIVIKLKDGTLFEVSANIVPNITGTIQRRAVQLPESAKCLLRDIRLADTIPSENETSEIDLLIGNDYYLDIILPPKMEVQPGLYLLGSRLRWILTGRTSEKESEFSEHNMLILTYGTEINQRNTILTEIDRTVPRKPDLEDFWNVESIGVTDNFHDNDDKKAFHSFKSTIKYQDGRYTVKWPWKDETLDLPNNRELAMGRLKSQLKRMKSRPELLKKYDSVIKEKLEKGVIEKVDDTMNEGLQHYLPHHAVVTPSKTTTKVCIVYDASAKACNENKSLNECLYRGPVMLQDLCGLLMRFRLNKIAIVADIEKAFLQLGLQDSERNITRFIWVKDIEYPALNRENIQEYRFCRVPFGIVSSPFLLEATVDHHLQSCEREIVEKLRSDIYVDNVITGANEVNDAVKLYKESKKMFSDASMNLREWVTNSDEVKKTIPQHDQGNTNKMKVLGHNWNVTTDTISLSSSKSTETIPEEVITKREVLKRIASIFDPMGLFTPLFLRGKVFLQTLWKKNLDWDEPLDSEDGKTWSVIKTDLERISSVEISRCIGLTKYALISFTVSVMHHRMRTLQQFIFVSHIRMKLRLI